MKLKKFIKINSNDDKFQIPGVQMPPTEFLRGDPTYASPNMPPSNFKSVKRCARQKSLCEYSREKT